MVSPVVMYRSECWTIKKAKHQIINSSELWCWRRLLRVPWTARRSNQSILKGDQSWAFIGRTDAEAEAPVLWPPDTNSCPIRKDPDARKDLKAGEGTTGDEVVGWHHWLNGHESEQALWRTGKSGVLQSVGQTQLSNNNNKTDLLLQNLQNYVWLQTRC